MGFRPDTIVIHCSATKDSGTVSWGAIRRFHVVERSWADIGYHFGVEKIGEDAEILLGRMPDRMGAHAAGHNSYTLGVCVVGDFDKELPPENIWSKAVQLCKWLCHNFSIQDIYGHRELTDMKTCPGLMFDLGKFRREVRG